MQKNNKGYGIQSMADEFRKGIYTEDELAGSFGRLSSPLLDMPLKNSLAMRDGVGDVTFTRSTTTTYIDRVTGLLKTAGIDEPVFEKEGYRASVASTNLGKNSQDLTQSTWNKIRSGIEANSTLAPDGTMTADKLVEDTTSGSDHYARMVVIGLLADDTTYTGSFYLKAGERSNALILFGDPDGSKIVNINLNDGSYTKASGVENAEVIKLDSGWYRCSVTITTTSASNNYFYCKLANDGDDYYDGDGASGLYVWGGQIEQLPFATPYIPTTTTAVTRSADSLTVDTLGNMNGILDPITIMLDVDVIGTGNAFIKVFTSGDLQLLSSYSGANDNYSYVFKENSSFTNLVQMPQGKFRYGATYDPTTTTLRMYHNGVMVAEGTSASTSNARASVATLMSGVEGYISNLKIYDKVLTEQEIKLLSGETK